MLDFVTSKIAMMIAAIIILTSVIGFYALQREQAKDMELQNIADKIAEAIHDVNIIQGETKVNVTFNRENEGVYVKPLVNGKSYETMITQNKVIITQNGKRSISNFVVSVHLWVPIFNAYNQTQIEEIDEANKTLELQAGEDFIIERKSIEVSGVNEYITFIYV